jgi:hypothetical protein
MGRPRKKPAFLVEATVRTNAKLADLSTDTARLGFFYAVLGEGKLALPIPGQFVSRNHFRELAGRFAEFTEEYIRVGILEVAPRVCERCATHWTTMPPRNGGLVVHDWHEFQYDPRKVERQREYEDRVRAHAGVSDGVSDAVSDAKLDGRTGVSDAVSDADSRAQVRARGRRRAVNPERRTENESSPHGRSLVNRDSPATPERADVQALLDHGYRRVTVRQRSVLDEIADRHRRRGDDGSWFAVETFAGADVEADPLQVLIATDKAEQTANRRRIEEEESIWATTKRRERAEAAAVFEGSRS